MRGWAPKDGGNVRVPGVPVIESERIRNGEGVESQGGREDRGIVTGGEATWTWHTPAAAGSYWRSGTGRDREEEKRTWGMALVGWWIGVDPNGDLGDECGGGSREVPRF